MRLYLADKALQCVDDMRADVAADKHEHYIIADFKMSVVQPHAHVIYARLLIAASTPAASYD